MTTSEERSYELVVRHDGCWALFVDGSYAPPGSDLDPAWHKPEFPMPDWLAAIHDVAKVGGHVDDYWSMAGSPASYCVNFIVDKENNLVRFA